MQLYSFIVELRIWHPSIDPEIISIQLNITPHIQYKAGERRRTRSGTILDGTWRESHWNAEVFEYGWSMSSDREVEDIVAEAVEALKPHRDFLVSLRTGGGRLLLQVSSHSSRNYALELSPGLMEDLCSLGVGFAHDVYPCQQNY